MNAVFLSASVPQRGREPYFGTANPYAIHRAVAAFLHVVLGRRLIVMGGHPSITPLALAAADDLGVEAGNVVFLYQSGYFQDRFPKENQEFGDYVIVPPVRNDLARSLLALRHAMFTAHEFEAAVFIGGMEGVLDECALFRQIHPNAKVIPIAAGGGAALEIAKEFPARSSPGRSQSRFISLFEEQLNINPADERQFSNRPPPRFA